MGTSHGTAGLGRKAPDDVADLERLQSVRRGGHRSSSGQSDRLSYKLCLKGLITYLYSKLVSCIYNLFV